MTLLLYIFSILILVYVCSFAVVTIGFYKQIHQNKFSITKSEELKISIVIAVRNEEFTIENCVDSLLNQNYNQDYFEVIIVDDHSTDHTLDVLSKLVEKFKNVSFYQLTNTFSKKEAIKLGVKYSKNEVIATTDADCILPPNWLNYTANKFNGKTNFLFGSVVLEGKNSFLNIFQQLDFFAMQGLTFGTSYYHQPILCNAANLSFKKDDYITLNDKLENKTPSGDDVFLLQQFKKNKRDISAFLNKNFIVQTKSEENLSGFIHQRIRWASKSKFYKNYLLLFFSYLVFFGNTSVLFIYYHIVFVEQNRGVYIILLLSKWLIDFILLFLVTSFFEKRKLMNYFLPVQLVYPIYILTIGLWSQFSKFKWKGRTYNG